MCVLKLIGDILIVFVQFNKIAFKRLETAPQSILICSFSEMKEKCLKVERSS